MSTDLEKTKAAIAGVSAQRAGAGSSTGTAFFIGGNYALTALHVVAERTAEPLAFYGAITLKFPGHETTATVVEGCWDRQHDWAVLECQTPPPVSPIPLGEPPNKEGDWEAFGYPEIQPAGMLILGKIRDPNAVLESGLQQTPVLQLYCEEAAAGRGARLHGFSGAPCLQNGAAVGLLRSTLIEEEIDGRLRKQLFTQAGTVYACPSKALVDWQAERGLTKRLPGNWSPPEIVGKDFIVFLSTAEAEDDGRKKLRDVVDQAYRRLEPLGLGEPHFEPAAALVASEESLLQVIPALCRANVVLFDATDFEPAMMLLAGIRAVVKRGVTILSVGGSYALGDRLEIPFNIKDANVVAHSEEQDAAGRMNSVELLSTRIEQGLFEMLKSPYYLDLPVFDALRKLPKERRGVIAATEGVLVLCSFHKEYTELNWEKRLRPALRNELDLLRKEKDRRPELGVARSFELNSPRLVSQAVYEYIRRAQACVVDLTDWSANVLFELGVRLAVTSGQTACILAKDWALKEVNEAENPKWQRLRHQCENLVKLFVPEELKYNPKTNWEKKEETAYRLAYGRNARAAATRLVSGVVHACIERSLLIENESASQPIYQELLNSAELFARPQGPGGKAKPVGLYPGNLELLRREEEAEFERLLAAWFYLRHRYPDDQAILTNEERRGAMLNALQPLFADRHAARLGTLPEGVKQALEDMFDKIEEFDPFAEKEKHA